MNNLERYISKSKFNNIKNCNDLYLKSETLVQILFKDKLDKAGYPYIDHLKRVSDNMTTLEGKIAGLLHDTVEDIDYITFKDLADIGIPQSIIEVLKLVTKKTKTKNLTDEEKLIRYDQEIDNIIKSKNEIAIELKFSDMTDNYSPKRLALCSKEKRVWFNKKYPPQLKKLHKTINNQ